MTIEPSTLRTDERAAFALRELFSAFGYSRYRMGRFEKYDLYVRSKDFLVSDRMITFTDTDGTLMALKPDVTMSIIRDTSDEPSVVRKLYYNENVYRVGRSGRFREIMQTGLECIGDLDVYSVCEVIRLAVRSLAGISADHVLDISHLGFVSAVMDAAGLPEERRDDALGCIRGKNSAGLAAVCRAAGLDEAGAALLDKLVTTYGPISGVTARLRELCGDDAASVAVRELEELRDSLEAAVLAERVRIDFSLVNNMRYYSGLVFQGFIKGISSGVLSGGQYDLMMRKMNRASGAVGFAVYLDELEAMDARSGAPDADVLLLYDSATPRAAIEAAVDRCAAVGERVLAQRKAPRDARFGRVEDMRGGAGA